MAIETRYTVGIERVRSLITTGPANLMLWGDSISSYGANPRLPTGMALEWAPPNGWAGWFLPFNLSASGPLTDYSGSYSEAQSWPFIGFSYSTLLGAAGFTVTDYTNPANYATTNVVASTPSPLPKGCRVISKSGSAWVFPEFTGTYFGPMGTCQSGRCWASGDWVTGKATNALRVGFVHLANSATVTTSMRLFTQEGVGNASGAAATTAVNTITPTAPGSPAVEICWASLAATSVDTPFGTVQNEPGVTQNPVYQQYESIGSTNPGTVMNGTYLAAAGNANWTGAWNIRSTYDASSTPSGTNIIPYGIILEDTTNPTGLYVDNISVSGDTIMTQVDGATVTQLANAINLNSARPINWFLMQIGENHTTAEWNGGSISSAQIRTDLLARIERCNRAWDAAGKPRGLITLVSPWETVGGTKSGSAWYTTVAGIMRQIARSNDQISFIDLRQMMADKYSTTELYNASRNANMNILYDGVHQSLRGLRVHARLLWHAIMGAVDPTYMASQNGRSDRGTRF